MKIRKVEKVEKVEEKKLYQTHESAARHCRGMQ
jgi:hypothetical protein